MATVETDNDAKKAGGYFKEKMAIAASRWSNDECIRAVTKVTSHKLKIPNEKHMARLVQATYGQYNSGDNTYDDINSWIVEQLTPHTHTRNWVVVLKTLIVFHTLLIDGSDEVVVRICANRQAFNTQHMKDLADSPDGALQMTLIHNYARYLEERCIASVACRPIGARFEQAEIVTKLCAMSAGAAAPPTDALLLQLDALLAFEFRPEALNNHASLDAFKKVLADAKRINIILTRRLAVMLEEFRRYPLPMKKIWFSIFKRYAAGIKDLAALFTRVNNNSVVGFGEEYPTLEVMHPSLLLQLQDVITTEEIPVVKLSDIVPAALLQSTAPPLPEERDARPKSPELFKRAVPAATVAATTAPTSPAPAAPAGGLFSAQPPPSATGSLFAPTAAAATSAPPPLFASTAAAPPAKSAIDDLFDIKPTNSTTAPVAQPRMQAAPEFDPFAAPPPQATQPVWVTPATAPASSTTTATRATEFDPFADVAVSTKPTSPQHVDFFAGGQPRAAPAATASAKSAPPTSNSEQQLDFFAQTATAPKRAW